MCSNQLQPTTHLPVASKLMLQLTTKLPNLLLFLLFLWGGVAGWLDQPGIMETHSSLAGAELDKKKGVHSPPVCTNIFFVSFKAVVPTNAISVHVSCNQFNTIVYWNRRGA